VFVFPSKTVEATDERRRLHNEGLYDLYSSPNIIRVIKSTRMKGMGRERCTQGFDGKPEERRPLGIPWWR
jgi:hypothetical protein